MVVATLCPFGVPLDEKPAFYKDLALVLLVTPACQPARAKVNCCRAGCRC